MKSCQPPNRHQTEKRLAYNSSAIAYDIEDEHANRHCGAGQPRTLLCNEPLRPLTFATRRPVG